LQRIKRAGDRWRNRDSSKDALEDSVWIVDDLTAEPSECWVISDRCLRHPFNQERTLFIIKKGCAAPVNNESARQCAERCEDSATPFFANLNARQEATTADRARSTRKCTLL